ncbi:MarR family winged helix-turn-helix transcriptional regulator [Bailinhaonella thermotolerans]|uniref:MarR family transcriptional regulator n=1 Tax=Bailinhaonella thermotolerans TaxID=1070861 RepID=A0A3A4B4H3_9ACTN|nr:MarR family transcriptional regulator [Bailinhaonella thermotolerans]RJL35480.1 MarR family transcriptional regulator [Bailinhaonella thermotolerans]
MGSSEERIQGHTGYLLAKLGSAAAARFERALEPLGLRPRHVMVLQEIRAAALSQQDLCAIIGMDRTTMVAVLDELERRGYAQRERSAADRRKHVVAPTPEGEAAFREAAGLMRAAEREFLAPLDEAQRDQLHHLVSLLYAPGAATPAPAAPDAGPAR